MLEIRPYRESDQARWSHCGAKAGWSGRGTTRVKDIHRKLRVQRGLFLMGTFDGRLVATAPWTTWFAGASA